MNFEPTVEQLELQRAIRALWEKRFPPERLRETAGRIERDDWDALTEAGVFALTVPEEDGGLGLGMTEAVLVFEELGRALVPGPLIGSLFGAKPESIVEVIHRDDAIVSHLDSLDALIILDADGIWAVEDLGGIETEPVAEHLDPLTPQHRLRSLVQGVRVAGSEASARRRTEGAALTAAQQVGIASRCTELAAAYAKEREQFGVPIGSFQAVKHICADMLVRAEVARAAVHAAGVLLDHPSAGDPARAAAAAKVVADEAAFRNAKDCVQVHGGMGFTWEVDVHLYLKRAAVLAQQFGTASEHAEAMASWL